MSDTISALAAVGIVAGVNIDSGPLISELGLRHNLALMPEAKKICLC